MLHALQLLFGAPVFLPRSEVDQQHRQVPRLDPVAPMVIDRPQHRARCFMTGPCPSISPVCSRGSAALITV